MYSAIKTALIFAIFYAQFASAQSPKLPADKTAKDQTQSPSATTKTPPVHSEPSSSEAQNVQACNKLFDKYAIPLQQLWSKRSPDLKPEMTDGYNLIEDFPKNGCLDSTVRKSIIELLAKILNTHTGKIGVLLPISKQNYLRHFLVAFESIVRSNNLDPKKVLIVIDTQGKPDKVVQAIATLIFQHKVSAIIGGTDIAEATILADWAPKLATPTFLLLEPLKTTATPFVYYAHPTQASLAKAAVSANLRYNHRRIAILSPLDQHSDKFIQEYELAAKEQNLEVSQRFLYDSKRFESMEAAARKIFRLETSDRRDELKALYENAKKKARETNTSFNPKMIALQPDIRFDAVLIPDNFKIVRHFSKIMTYLGARKLPLFGHFEWRGIGLVEPWDSFINGSYFVDFQGSYLDLPDPIKIQTQGSPYFVSPDKVEQADFSLVAWRAMDTPLQLSLRTKDPRRKLEKYIPKKSQNPDLVSYDENQVILWPASTFSISGLNSKTGQIMLLGRTLEAKP